MMCLLGKEKLAILKEYNLKRHYATKHGEHYGKNKGEEKMSQTATKEDYYPSKNFSTKPVRTLMLPSKQVM